MDGPRPAPCRMLAKVLLYGKHEFHVHHVHPGASYRAEAPFVRRRTFIRRRRRALCLVLPHILPPIVLQQLLLCSLALLPSFVANFPDARTAATTGSATQVTTSTCRLAAILFRFRLSSESAGPRLSSGYGTRGASRMSLRPSWSARTMATVSPLSTTGHRCGIQSHLRRWTTVLRSPHKTPAAVLFQGTGPHVDPMTARNAEPSVTEGGSRRRSECRRLSLSALVAESPQHRRRTSLGIKRAPGVLPQYRPLTDLRQALSPLLPSSH